MMRFGLVGRTIPVLLLVGGIAAPLAVAEFLSEGDQAPGLAVAKTTRSDLSGFGDAVFQPAAAEDCALAQGNTAPLGASPAHPAAPYDLPVAEGATPTSPHQALAMPALGDAPIVLGTRLRISAEAAEQHYRLTIACAPAAAPEPAAPLKL